jgi:hypothetical protein
MKWPWNRRTPPAPAATETQGGARAHQQAQESLDAARARWPEVHEVAGSLRRLRRDNGFREQIEYLFEGGRSS